MCPFRQQRNLQQQQQPSSTDYYSDYSSNNSCRTTQSDDSPTTPPSASSSSTTYRNHHHSILNDTRQMDSAIHAGSTSNGNDGGGGGGGGGQVIAPPSQQQQQPIPIINDENNNHHLAMPEIIEMLKNLAACKEKQFMWEQSAKKLAIIPDTDPNKNQLLEIIDFVENKPSSREKAIYLYEQLGRKCHQHKNYIGAAKAFERAASLLFAIPDREDDRIDADEETISSTIRYLESAIHNYDAIHKYKHAGTLHYRCSRILRLINASREEVERHHLKALEYFTKPNHELKQRKRIDGLKISCYSSCSTWAGMTQLNDELDNKIHTTTHTTTTNTIKFHSDGCYRDSDDSDSNHSSSPSPQSAANVSASTNSKKLQFFQDDPNSYGPMSSDDYFDNYFHGAIPNMDSDSYNSSIPGTPTTPPISSLLPEKPQQQQPKVVQVPLPRHLYHESKEQHHQHVATRSHHKHHSASFTYHHHKQQKLLATGNPSSLNSAYHHHPHHSHLPHHPHHHSSGRDSANSMSSAKGTYRCIENRIESARKLVKKLHKLCPFYEVSNVGEDAGRVYCRICDRYLGAVSSTLKNHINTQEHRQAYEDSQTEIVPLQQPLPQSNPSVYGMTNGTTGQPLPLPAPNPIPQITYTMNGVATAPVANTTATNQPEINPNRSIQYGNIQPPPSVPQQYQPKTSYLSYENGTENPNKPTIIQTNGNVNGTWSGNNGSTQYDQQQQQQQQSSGPRNQNPNLNVQYQYRNGNGTTTTTNNGCQMFQTSKPQSGMMVPQSYSNSNNVTPNGTTNNLPVMAYQ